MRKKIRIKRRFYVILAVLAFMLFVLFIKILQGSSEGGVQAFIDQESAPDPFSDGNLVVCLDAGHGGYDVGAESIMDYYEKDINLKIALEVGKLLEKNEYKIIYTRTIDEDKGDTKEEDLKARCDIANEGDADIFVSIHCNFDKRSLKSKGFEVWCRYPEHRGEELAKYLGSQLKEVGYTRDRGLKYESDRSLYVLRSTKAVAALVELGFLSNTEDSIFLKSDDGQKKCAEAIAKGIEDYINEYHK